MEQQGLKPAFILGFQCHWQWLYILCHNANSSAVNIYIIGKRVYFRQCLQYCFETPTFHVKVSEFESQIYSKSQFLAVSYSGKQEEIAQIFWDPANHVGDLN